MSVEEVSVAAASAPVQTNLLANSDMRQAGHRRVLKTAGLAGSAAAGDTIVEIKVGARTVARLFNTATGFPTADHDRSVNAVVPANAELSAIVTDAPATNPINLKVEFMP